MRGNEGTTMRWVMTALSAATLAACGGSGPSNELPKGIKEIGATAYPATTVGKGDTAATQDLLTGGRASQPWHRFRIPHDFRD